MYRRRDGDVDDDDDGDLEDLLIRCRLVLLVRVSDIKSRACRSYERPTKATRTSGRITTTMSTSLSMRRAAVLFLSGVGARGECVTASLRPPVVASDNACVTRT